MVVFVFPRIELLPRSEFKLCSGFAFNGRWNVPTARSNVSTDEQGRYHSAKYGLKRCPACLDENKRESEISAFNEDDFPESVTNALASATDAKQERKANKDTDEDENLLRSHASGHDEILLQRRLVRKPPSY
jgi:hypothetical protein